MRRRAVRRTEGVVFVDRIWGRVRRKVCNPVVLVIAVL